MIGPHVFHNSLCLPDFLAVSPFVEMVPEETQILAEEQFTLVPVGPSSLVWY